MFKIFIWFLNLVKQIFTSLTFLQLWFKAVFLYKTSGHGLVLVFAYVVILVYTKAAPFFGAGGIITGILMVDT